MNQAASSRSSGVDSIFRTADVVGDAWPWLVMREVLLYEASRFDELQQRLGLARSTLSARLTQLVAGGLLVKARSEYLPTDAGRDFIGCLLVAMRWGDQWHFPSDSPPQPITHLGCGQPLHAVLQCGACREPLNAHDVSAHRADTVARPHRAAGRKRRSPDLALLERTRTCSIARTLSVTGDWWSGLITRECFFGTRRFDEFERRLGIAPNILSGRLRRLVELDMLSKVQYETWPVRHEYRLTEKGLDYYPIPLAMLTWGRHWLAPNADARLTHTPCSRALDAELACASCGGTVSLDDIALTSSSDARADASKVPTPEGAQYDRRSRS